MDYFHEDETINGRLFNRQVASLLARYVGAHKKHLVVSLALVAIITAATLAVPFISKFIIDRLVVKQGAIAIVSGAATGGAIDPLIVKRLSRGVRLSEGSYFVMQSEFSYFSKKELDRLTQAGVLAPGKFTLVESPTLTPAIEAKLRELSGKGQVRAFSRDLYCFSSAGLRAFTVREMALLRGHDLERIVLYVLGILAILSINFIVSYFQNVSLINLSQKAMRDLRMDLFAHILSLKLSFFDKNPVGKLVNRVTNDIEALNEMFSSVLVTLFQDLLILTGITIIMFSTSFVLGATVAVTFPALIAITIAFRVQARKAYRNIRTKIAAMNAFLNENISGIRIVQIFGQEAKQIGKFAAINKGLFQANMQQVYVYGVFRPLIEMFKWFAVAAALCIGAWLIGNERISYGLIVMFLTYIGTFFEPLGDLAEKFDTMQSATAAGEKILLLLNEPGAVETPGHGENNGRETGMPPMAQQHSRTVAQGAVRFDDVWFAYKPDEWVLRGVSFSIERNHTLAIVGETGSGKTTIAGLLTRLYDPQKGAISIGGKSIGSIPYDVVRRNVGMVMQDVFLFSRIVAENITLDAPFDKQAFDHACRLSHCDKFISGLPHGAEEPVMERGATFSAGERQLIAFARALYFDPSILILDEATSNIDTETEKLIQDAIAHLIKGRTSLIIAHRLSTIRSADEIIVLDKGTIAERGNHEKLMALRGKYYDLYSMQFERV
jgi:ATP-binding cassette, subfamily B, multidrug efflux pump